MGLYCGCIVTQYDFDLPMYGNGGRLRLLILIVLTGVHYH